MLRPAAVLVFALIAATARADELSLSAPVQLAPPAAVPALRLRQVEIARDEASRSHALRSAGIATAVIGTVLTGVGIGLLMANVGVDHPDAGDVAEGRASLGLLIIGPAALIAGIPMWAVGQTRTSRAERVLMSLSASGARLLF